MTDTKSSCKTLIEEDKEILDDYETEDIDEEIQLEIRKEKEYDKIMDRIRLFMIDYKNYLYDNCLNMGKNLKPSDILHFLKK